MTREEIVSALDVPEEIIDMLIENNEGNTAKVMAQLEEMANKKLAEKANSQN